MQYMLLIHDDEKAFASFPEAQRAAAMEEYGEFTQGIVKSGHFRAGAQLQPTATTTTLREKNGKRVTTDGPFAETKEQLGGYYLIECKDLDEALAIARRVPAGGPGQAIEVRPLVPISQVGEDATGAVNLAELHRREYGRILASLIRATGDFDLAEDALQEAFAAALAQWPAQGPPRSPVSWVIGTARHKAIDQLRHRGLAEEKRAEIAALAASEEDEPVPLDSLRLIFTCCHPALAPEAQVALTLRTLGGLETEEIARAFLVPAPTLAQRLVRAKAKIKGAGIRYEVPADEVLAQRLGSVLEVVYLIFNEGYSASFGDDLVRADLSAEAIRLGRLLIDLLPAEGEPKGLLALMLFHDSRRATRTDARGEMVLLEDQDRSRWDRAKIVEGAALVEPALRARPPGEYAVQAAIAGLHAQAPTARDTDWPQIAALYGVLASIHPSPVVALNRAVAIAMADGLEQGLAALETIHLPGYHLLPAARADLLRRQGRHAEAAAAYREALALVTNEAERRFLARRLAEVTRPAG